MQSLRAVQFKTAGKYNPGVKLCHLILAVLDNGHQRKHWKKFKFISLSLQTTIKPKLFYHHVLNAVAHKTKVSIGRLQATYCQSSLKLADTELTNYLQNTAGNSLWFYFSCFLCFFFPFSMGIINLIDDFSRDFCLAGHCNLYFPILIKYIYEN